MIEQQQQEYEEAVGDTLLQREAVLEEAAKSDVNVLETEQLTENLKKWRKINQADYVPQIAEPHKVALVCDSLTVFLRSQVEQLIMQGEQGLAFVAVAQYLSSSRHKEEAEALRQLFGRPKEDFAVIRAALPALGDGGLTKVADINQHRTDLVDKYAKAGPGMDEAAFKQNATLLALCANAGVCLCARLMDRAVQRYLDPKLEDEAIDDETCPVYYTLTQADRTDMFRWNVLKSEPDKLAALGPKIKAIAVKLRHHGLEQRTKRVNQALSQKFYPNLFRQHGSNLL